MDNSETFIKMCDCKEIQNLDPCKLKVYEAGNWYFLKEEKRVTTQEYEDSFFDYVWLPRQDQLQEMVTFPDHPYYQIGRFNRVVGEWCDENYLASGASMEQLWLAFVMKEKYNRVWNDKKWVLDKGRHPELTSG